MTCSECGAMVVELVDESGGTSSGRFTEEYRCGACGATGRIRGDASAPPTEWTRTGGVFGK